MARILSLAPLSHLLKKLARAFNSEHQADCCLFLSLLNRLEYLADPGATMTFVAGGALKPIGGHILSHASTTRLFLRKGSRALLKLSKYD
jgi:meiotic recombination protein DMC1